MYSTFRMMFVVVACDWDCKIKLKRAGPYKRE